MPWFHEVLTLISRSRARSRTGLGVRVLAGVLSAVLVFGSIAPGVAFAGEADSEQEGSAPPGALPGLEEGADFEPGGEEAVLEEVPGAVSGGEESEEGSPLESEPPQESEPPLPPPEAPAASVGLSPPTGEESASVPPQGPTYTPAEEPTAEAVPSPPVENQSLTAPESPRSEPQAQPAAEAVQAAPEAPPPVSPPEAPEPATAQPPSVPAQRNGAAGSLAGHFVHTVKAGECLWAIAEALLPVGAGTSEIEAEVQHLWKLNAARIGTDDPNLLYVGTELRLR